MGFTHWDWDLATGNGMNNYKMGMGFLFFSGLCSNILKQKNKISAQQTLHSTVETVKSVFFSFAPAVQLPGLLGCIVTFCRFSWLADKFCKFAVAGRYCEGKIKVASEKVSRKMVLEIKYVNANKAVIHTENSKLQLDLNCSSKQFGNWDFGKNQPGNWDLGQIQAGNWDLVPPFTTLYQVLHSDWRFSEISFQPQQLQVCENRLFLLRTIFKSTRLTSRYDFHATPYINQVCNYHTILKQQQ